MVTRRTHEEASTFDKPDQPGKQTETRSAPARAANGMRRSNGQSHGQVGGVAGDVSAVTAAVAVGVAAAMLEAELLPGIAIGAAAMLVGKMFPRIARAFRPVAKTVVRAGVAVADKGREMVAETGEQMQDMVAEVRAEREETRREGGTAAAAA